MRLGHPVAWDLAYCSRSGPPSQPWLEPDVNDHLTALAADGVTAVVLSPIGFVSDHMEVAFDLDTEALETAAELGLVAVRADSVGMRAPFVRGLVDLVVERAATARATDAGVEPAPRACRRQLPRVPRRLRARLLPDARRPADRHPRRLLDRPVVLTSRPSGDHLR